MNLITVLLLLIAIWVFYKIYQAYTDIVNELKQIKEKCISKEPLVSHISENYTNKTAVSIKEGLLDILKKALI
jgi:Na+/melibiose symporter-like transporter